jgi:hypothetical protein
MDTIVELKIHKAKKFLTNAIKVGSVTQEMSDGEQVLKDLKDIFNIG